MSNPKGRFLRRPASIDRSSGLITPRSHQFDHDRVNRGSADDRNTQIGVERPTGKSPGIWRPITNPQRAGQTRPPPPTQPVAGTSEGKSDRRPANLIHPRKRKGGPLDVTEVVKGDLAIDKLKRKKEKRNVSFKVGIKPTQSEE